MGKNKLNDEERALEIVERFNNIGIEFPLNIQCALELVKENLYIFGYSGPCYRNDNRYPFWNRIKTILENKLK